MKDKFNQFKNQWLGKYPDFDGYFGSQCVDLAQYWSQFLGGPRFSGDAHNIYNQAGSFYDQIPNTPEAVPQVGDIVIFSADLNGGPGHICVATGENSNADEFESMDVNWPMGSAAHIMSHNYKFVLGWLRSKNQFNDAIIPQTSAQPTITDQTIIPVGVNPHTSTDWTGELQALRSEIFDMEVKRDGLANDLSILKNTPPKPQNSPNPPSGTISFSNPLANFLYSLAKAIG